MGAATRIIECSCGTISDVVCDGCGQTVCSRCSTAQMCFFGPGHVQIKRYCSGCASDVRKNVWGELYWKAITSPMV
jgi:hypothetical protein